ncbi:hypothetical protein ACFYXC_41200 [Streptomyces sp. NPDC002701]|uniref:hypothetical protein n=1 Tax=Streptomyces sp. NPDC002701 TaxID=3364661 RepID=UPI003678763E
MQLRSDHDAPQRAVGVAADAQHVAVHRELARIMADARAEQQLRVLVPGRRRGAGVQQDPQAAAIARIEEHLADRRGRPGAGGPGTGRRQRVVGAVSSSSAEERVFPYLIEAEPRPAEVSAMTRFPPFQPRPFLVEIGGLRADAVS